MPQREARFTVNAPPRELWKFIRDMESLCTCIPAVEKIVLLDERSADLTVREKVGVIPMVLTLRASIDSEDPPRRLHATARAEHLTMDIDVSLEAAANGTELRALFDVTGTGQLKPIVDRLFEKRATERAAQFADALQKRFGAVPVAGAAPHAPAGWFTRVWRRLLAWFAPPRN